MTRKAHWLLLFLIGSCAVPAAKSAHGAEAAAAQEEAAPQPLPDDYFAATSTCINAWSALHTEWLEAGGGVKNSLAQMRRQIEAGKRSRLAALVRQSWAEQAEARPAAELGHWPVDPAESRRVLSGLPLSASGLPDECRVALWLDGFLWNDLQSGKDGTLVPIAEMPASLPRESPAAQQWLRYWLFVRLRPGG